MVIDVEVPTPEAPGEDVLAKAANRGSPFDSQLYLFEALGTTISLLSSHPSEQVGILRALLEPLLRDIQIASAAPASNLASLLRLHHLIKAVGNIAYGFPEVRAGSASPTAEWVTVLRNALGMILDSLKAKSEVAIIREAVGGLPSWSPNHSLEQPNRQGLTGLSFTVLHRVSAPSRPLLRGPEKQRSHSWRLLSTAWSTICRLRN